MVLEFADHREDQRFNEWSRNVAAQVLNDLRVQKCLKTTRIY